LWNHNSKQLVEVRENKNSEYQEVGEPIEIAKENFVINFDILLTVHLNIFILILTNLKH